MGNGAAPRQERTRLNFASEIEYAIVALNLSAPEIARIVKDATGITLDPKSTDFLQTLHGSHLEALWKRLSADRRWIGNT